MKGGGHAVPLFRRSQRLVLLLVGPKGCWDKDRLLLFLLLLLLLLLLW